MWPEGQRLKYVAGMPRIPLSARLPLRGRHLTYSRPNCERFECHARFARVRTYSTPKSMLSLHFSEARERCSSPARAARRGRKTEQSSKGLVRDGGGRELNVTFTV